MISQNIEPLFHEYLSPNNHATSDYFALIKKLVGLRNSAAPGSADFRQASEAITKAYGLVEDEIRTNTNAPTKEVSFGTSGWRGIIGKDFSLQSVGQVTQAIVAMYRNLDQDDSLAAPWAYAASPRRSNGAPWSVLITASAAVFWRSGLSRC